MTDSESSTDAEADARQPESAAEEDGVEPYEVFVQWTRGKPHEHAETIDAPSDRMALMLAKRNIDVRQEPLSVWVVPRSEVTRSSSDDSTLKPGTDRSYRNIQWYAENKVDVTELGDAVQSSGRRSEDR